MGFFDCCHNCPPNKRHEGCHSTCEDYIKEQARWSEHKKVINENRLKEFQVRPAKTDYLNKPVWRNKKH